MKIRIYKWVISYQRSAWINRLLLFVALFSLLIIAGSTYQRRKLNMGKAVPHMDRSLQHQKEKDPLDDKGSPISKWFSGFRIHPSFNVLSR